LKAFSRGASFLFPSFYFTYFQWLRGGRKWGKGMLWGESKGGRKVLLLFWPLKSIEGRVEKTLLHAGGDDEPEF